MTDRTFLRASRFLVVPAVFASFLAARLLGRTYAIDQWIPYEDTFLLLAMMILVERIYQYEHAVSQRSVLARDLLSSAVNIFVTASVTRIIILPVLTFSLVHLLGRKLVLPAADLLGSIWLQVLIISVSISFCRYWMHRLQHSIRFLWALHSYHHRVTDVQVTNTLVSHPIDFALRNVMFGLLAAAIGFDPFALFVATSIMFVPAIFSHCGGDVKAGLLNYLFITPETHRWHHSVTVPEGFGHSCNYGLDFSLWDMIFGTFYLPLKNSVAGQPERMGYPGGGLPDESNYLTLLLAPLGLYGPPTYGPPTWSGQAGPIPGAPDHTP